MAATSLCGDVPEAKQANLAVCSKPELHMLEEGQ